MHVHDEVYSNIAACKDADRTWLNHKGSIATNKQEIIKKQPYIQLHAHMLASCYSKMYVNIIQSGNHHDGSKLKSNITLSIATMWGTSDITDRGSIATGNIRL